MKAVKILLAIMFLTGLLIGSGTTSVKAEMMVYDADGQFLGFFVDEGKVYNPSYKSFVSFSLSTGYILTADLYFESNDCSGAPYIRTNPNKILKHDDKYYKTDNVAVREINFSSAISNQYLACNTFQNPFSFLAVPAQEIESPYDLPVTLPLEIKFKPTHPGKWNEEED